MSSVADSGVTSTLYSELSPCGKNARDEDTGLCGLAPGASLLEGLETEDEEAKENREPPELALFALYRAREGEEGVLLLLMLLVLNGRPADWTDRGEGGCVGNIASNWEAGESNKLGDVGNLGVLGLTASFSSRLNGGSSIPDLGDRRAGETPAARGTKQNGPETCGEERLIIE